jgi:hypothetical protein
MPTGTRRPAAFALLAVAVLLVAGCRTGGPGDAQPAPEVSGFRQGGFDELPRYRGSEELGVVSEDGDVVTQSFSAEGTSPELVLDFYRKELEGWTSLGREDVGDALREDFRDGDGNRLEVSATTLSQGGSDLQPTVQYSLVLHQG